METIILKRLYKNLSITFFGDVYKILVFGALEVAPEI